MYESDEEKQQKQKSTIILCKMNYIWRSKNIKNTVTLILQRKC